MPFWMNTYFTNANSPVMEQMIMFHDHSMTIISSIIIFLTIKLLNLANNNIMYLNFLENQLIEIVWTLLPMVLLIFIALPSLRLLYLMEESFSPSLTIKIIGHQWYWSYEYSDFNINFDSFIDTNFYNNKFRLLETDQNLLLPMSSFSRLLITSADVIHSWTIQSMGVKTDAIPGRLNQINLMSTRPGLYYGQCSEICGSNHSFMPIKLEILSTNLFSKKIMKLMN